MRAVAVTPHGRGVAAPSQVWPLGSLKPLAGLVFEDQLGAEVVSLKSIAAIRGWPKKA
jgi:hypothetical protein